MKAPILSVIVSIIVLGIKTYAYSLTKSQAVFSDALESIVNVVASIVALWVIFVSRQPADEDHPYGHGKVEYFSSAFEGGLVCFASLMIGAEAIRAWIDQKAMFGFESGMLLLAVATLFNLALGIYLKIEAQKTHSEALAASSAHVLSDIWTTVGAVISIGLVMVTGQLWIDFVVALSMAGLLLYSGFKIVRRSMGALMDERESEDLEELAKVFNQYRVPGIIDIHQTKMIRSGHFHHIDAHVVVPEFWSVLETHEKTGELESSVVNAYKFEGEIAFHVDPCKMNYCSRCDLKECEVRRMNFVKIEPMTAKSLTRIPGFDQQG